MDATQLSKDLEAAVIEQFGDALPAEALPQKYFNYGVFSIDPRGQLTQRSPRYCATAFGASALAIALQGEGESIGNVLLGNAINFTGLFGSFSDTELVPYLQFLDSNGHVGKPINAGLLLDYFNHGSSPGQVKSGLANALNEIKGAFA